jgi:DNA-binding transcriptional regulator LsrR (DeoR family)
MELEHRVAGFGVRRVEVVGCAHSVGHAAARFFEREAKSGQTLVLDGGKTVGAFVEALASHAFERMTIIPICADPASCEIAAYELVTRVAVKYPIAGTCEKLPYWHGPHLDEIHDRIRRRARKADFVILGAGPWQRHYTALDFVKHLGLDSEAIYAKYRGRVCGVVGYCAVARDGHHVTLKEIDERLPRSLDFDDLKRMAESNRCRCILVAAGARKVEAVTAVLAARVVNTLILDRRLATCLLTRLGTRR